MEEKKSLLTFTGLKKLEEELHDLKVVKRKEVAGKIKEAREQGDLSENAEYDAAKDEQRDIEARIEEIEKILKNVEVVDEDEVDLDKISVGCKVKVYDMEFDEEMEFRLVGSSEANSLQGKISNESPVGRALIGAKEGDVVEVAQQQHDPADDGQGQEPGGQTVQTSAMGEIQPGQQQGDEEDFQMFPQALPHRRDQSGDGAGQPGEEKMKPYPQDQGGNQGKNRLFLKNFHSSHLVSYYKLCPQWGKL